ncbi:hypothetical protein [Streptomyces tanashiensis]|uniref:hypothetical protein n=1 Tax=Streptomyces tanashiensis TaxID=67367 RepID=UPI0033EC4D3A
MRTSWREAIRRCSALVPGLAYVTRLLAGDVPTWLLTMAHQELVDPLDPVLAVRTFGVDADF